MSQFGRPVSTASPRAQKRGPKHPLAGSGPIVDRARQALARTAAEFGEVYATTHTTVSTRSADGIELELSYAPGNYLFSRVYGLTITARLPHHDAVPRGVKLTHRGAQRGGTFVSARGAAADAAALQVLNATATSHLAAVDLLDATISSSGPTTLSLTPMGGSYVWVLIPPVFKATAFPPGEPERLLNLVRAIREITPPATSHPAAPRQKGTQS